MSDSAQPTMNLLQHVRSSFGQGNGMSTQVLSDMKSVVATPTQAPAVLTDPIVSSGRVSTEEQLDVLDKVLQQVEQQVAQVVPTPPVITPQAPVFQPPAATYPPAPSSEPLTAVSAAVPLAVSQATDTLNPQVPVPVASAKEALERTAQPDMSKVDAGTGVQVVEYEPTPEIPVEVESFLQKVEDNQDQLPQEIVIAGNAAQLVNPAPALRPMIVLPITPEVEAVGAKKNSQWSIRWLVEWSRRLMKMFSGKILYSE